jgi:hypothetical protein
MGDQHTSDIHLLLKRLVTLRFDGFLEEGVHDWVHVLGIGRLDWAVALTDIQRAIRANHNKNFTISFDCASPFLATANGAVYHDILTPDRKKWSTKVSSIADDKKYATDTRSYRDAVLQDGLVKNFEDSPISKECLIKDICYYAPGMLNKIGKEGRTSWDSFSYALLMGHNVWTHIESVQRSNREYDAGLRPNTLVDERITKVHFRDIVDSIFAATSEAAAYAIIDKHDKFWQQIIGVGRGVTGKNTVNSGTMFNVLFDNTGDTDPDVEIKLDDSKLIELENNE